MFIRRILFCGGGIRVIAHIGVIGELERQNMLTPVREWAGVSAGALVAMCLAVGYTTRELTDFCIGFDFHNAMELDSAPGWLINLGFDTGERLTRMIEACLHVKGLPSDLTFAQCLQKFQVGLKVYATDLRQGTLVIFSPSTTPNSHIAHAVRASMSFPYYFQPVEDPATGAVLSDGGIISNYPFYTFTPAEQEETLGILFEERCPEVAAIDLEAAILRPIKIVLHARTYYEKKFANTILVDTLGVDAFDVGLTKEIKLALLANGAAATSAFFKERQKRLQIHRRYSVG